MDKHQEPSGILPFRFSRWLYATDTSTTLSITDELRVALGILQISQFSRVPSDPKMGFPLTFAPKSRVFVYFSHLCG